MLLRHAKAVAHGRGEDFARKLTDKGTADALRLGSHMRETGLLPEVAFVSNAARTRQTYELFGKGSKGTCRAHFEDGLYSATASDLRDLLKVVDASIDRLMIVGHNPGIVDVAILLAREGDPAELARMSQRFPPCALAVLSFDVDNWQDARARGGRLDTLLLPEDLASSH